MNTRIMLLVLSLVSVAVKTPAEVLWEEPKKSELSVTRQASKTKFGDLNDIYDRNSIDTRIYDSIRGQTIKGPKYKVGVMGHRKVVVYGTDLRVKYAYLQNYDGEEHYTNKNEVNQFKVIKSEGYSITNSVSTTANIQIGIQEIISKSIGLLGNLVNYGSSGTASFEYSIGKNKFYSREEYKTIAIEKTVFLDNIPEERYLFSYGEIAVSVVIPIVKSYTEEDKGIFGGWKMLKNTLKENYSADYYLRTYDTIIYPNGYFGNKVNGIFQCAEYHL